MEIRYQETTSDLLTRIDIHKKYGGQDIDRWMLDLLAARKGSRILDVGCGAGKQCFAFFDELAGDCDVTGGDVSPELLERARLENARTGNKIRFVELDFGRRFDLEDAQFDLISACFTIYYAKDIPFTISEMHRVLRPGGRLFTSGPMPQNKRLFYDVIREATSKPIPPMPGSSRYGTEILATIRKFFADVEVHIFENPLTFAEVEPFLDYTRASLSEDRKLWGAFFDDSHTFEAVMARIAEVARRRLANERPLVMTKVVGGFLATK
jgi:ubiquinone/menaquinone biosynthesis C-methylase UbiE